MSIRRSPMANNIIIHHKILFNFGRLQTFSSNIALFNQLMNVNTRKALVVLKWVS